MQKVDPLKGRIIGKKFLDDFVSALKEFQMNAAKGHLTGDDIEKLREFIGKWEKDADQVIDSVWDKDAEQAMKDAGIEFGAGDLKGPINAFIGKFKQIVDEYDRFQQKQSQSKSQDERTSRSERQTGVTSDDFDDVNVSSPRFTQAAHEKAKAFIDEYTAEAKSARVDGYKKGASNATQNAAKQAEQMISDAACGDIFGLINKVSSIFVSLAKNIQEGKLRSDSILRNGEQKVFNVLMAGLVGSSDKDSEEHEQNVGASQGI